MLRANIFKQDITSNSQRMAVDKVQNFNHSLVEITSKQISFKSEAGILQKFNLEFFEEDMYTTTHIGRFEDGTAFRLTQPQGLALNNVKSEYRAKGAFTLGSLNPDGFAVHFILTDINDIRSIDINSTGDNEQIQRLIDGALMSSQFGLQQKFMEITKRLLSVIESNPANMRNFNNSAKLSQLMKYNLDEYSSNEKLLIRQL